MFKTFFILFLLVPAIELYVLIEVGGMIGGFYTVLLVFLTAFIGAALMREQGSSALQRAQESLSQGQVPQAELLEGMFIFVGGLLLLVPGLLTDTLGFVFLIPPIRTWLANKLVAQQIDQFNAFRHRSHGDDSVYDGEWTEKNEAHSAHRQIDLQADVKMDDKSSQPKEK